MASNPTAATDLPVRTDIQDGIDGARAAAANQVDKEAAKKLKKAEKAQKAEKAGAKDKTAQKQVGGGGGAKAKAANAGPALIGITTKKEDDLSNWYIEVIKKAEFLDYSDTPGFFIMPPASTAVWESIQSFLDARIKKMGVKNCHFPLVIAEERLATEKEHLEGFAAEVAWITHGGKEKLAQRLAVRPTSETAMYPYFATKIRSHRDLPLKLNQWNNVVRWEFKHAIPFLRSREFYWQEGHTAHLTQEEAGKEVLEVLDHYAAVYEDLLAVPVVKGMKTDNEKFAGALYTTTIEGFIPAVGRGIQAGTSHCLGQHFSKMFNITVEDPSGDTKTPLHVWQNSWGFTTRSIGVMVMVHSDNKGLVIPPRAAETQVIIVPVGITAKTSTEASTALLVEIEALQAVLQSSAVRVDIDRRENYTSGYKFNDWELKGVPLRLEFGPHDSAAHVVTYSRRDLDASTGGKGTIPISELGVAVPALLETIQADLYARADREYCAHRVQIESWDAFVPALDAKNVCLIRHCLGGPCEDEIKELSKRAAAQVELAEDAKAPSMGAKSLCIPFEQPDGIVAGETKCTNPNCEAMAQKWVLFGRSY